MPYRDPEAQRAYAKRHYLDNAAAYRARAAVNTIRTRDKHRRLLDQLKAVPCADCGNSYPPYVMDFHHVLGEKLFSIADFLSNGVGTKKLLAEVGKCVVICSNCHRIRTHGSEAG